MSEDKITISVLARMMEEEDRKIWNELDLEEEQVLKDNLRSSALLGWSQLIGSLRDLNTKVEWPKEAWLIRKSANCGSMVPSLNSLRKPDLLVTHPATLFSDGVLFVLEYIDCTKNIRSCRFNIYTQCPFCGLFVMLVKMEGFEVKVGLKWLAEHQRSGRIDNHVCEMGGGDNAK